MPPAPRPPAPRDPRVTWDHDHPWRRQPCDDDSAWKAFQRYLYQRQRPRRGPATTEHTLAALTWGWEWRAARWDDENDAQRERREATAATRHRTLAMRVQRLGGGEVNALLAAQRAAPSMVGLLSPAVALRYVSEGIDLERAAMGLTPAVAPASDPGEELDWSALEDHEADTLRALVAKARGF